MEGIHTHKMNKLTEKQIKEIRERKAKGESSYKLAEEFNVAQSTICYHVDKTSKKRVSYRNRKEYQKQYFKNRYKENEEFRERHKARCRKKVEEE